MSENQTSSGLWNLSFDELKQHMGNHSNEIISDILDYTKTNSKLKDNVVEKIRQNIIDFLAQKAVISAEYLAGDENGETYHFENRENYRQKMTVLIQSILQLEKSDSSTDLKAKLQKIFENQCK